MSNGRPRPAFFAFMALVVIGLVVMALNRMGVIKGFGSKSGSGGSGQTVTEKPGAEAPDAQGITTVKEYNYVQTQRLPEVKGISNYKPMTDRTVKMALNVWAGWAPVIFANNGFKAGKTWTTPGGKPFKVDLVLIDDPVAMRDAYAAGDVHVGWATLDMLPLMVEGLKKDSRTMPRV